MKGLPVNTLLIPHSCLYSTVRIHNGYLGSVNGIEWPSHQILFWKPANQKADS